MSNLRRVNNFLAENAIKDEQACNTVLNGPDALKNILINETIKLNRLEQVSVQLINYLTEHNQLKKLSHKEKQSLLMDISEIQNNSRDFIFKVAELSSKNVFLQEILKLNQQTTHIETSVTGEKYLSSIDDDTRRNLTELLRTVVIENTAE